MAEMSDYQLSFTIRKGILEIVITGDMTKEAINMVHDEVMTVIRENHPKAVLADIRSANGPSDYTDAYYRVRSFPPEVSMLPLGVVDRPENWEFKSFFETTAANAGLSLKWFTDMEDTRTWLKSKIQK